MKNIKSVNGIAFATTAAMLALCMIFSMAASAYTTNPEAYFKNCRGTTSGSWKKCGSEWYKPGSNSNTVFYKTGIYQPNSYKSWPWSYYKVSNCWIVDYQKGYTTAAGVFTNTYAYNLHKCTGTRNCASFCIFIDGKWTVRGDMTTDCCT